MQPPGRRPKALQGVFDAMAEQNFASIEEANAWLQRAMESYNASGQDDFGGLSPEQMFQLQQDDWSGRGVARIATDLTWNEVAGSAWLQGARCMLRGTVARGPIQLTGDLEADQASIDARSDDMLEAAAGLGTFGMDLVAGPMAPEGLFFSEVLELLLYAGLLLNRRKTFVASKRALALTKEQKGGELYRVLLRAFLADMSLKGLHATPGGLEGVEEAKSFTAYRLLQEGTRWRRASWLAGKVMHPDLAGWIKRSKLPRELRGVPLTVLILQPLVQLNLLEGRSAKGATESEFRCTPLFERAISFDWPVVKAPVVSPVDVRRN